MSYMGDISRIPGYAQGRTIIQSTLNNRPPAGFKNTLFIATDTNTIFRDTGTEWVVISSTSGGNGGINLPNGTYYTFTLDGGVLSGGQLIDCGEYT